MWPTDRVRVCVKELCRMNGLAYIPVSREEGLVLLASFAHISVTELVQTNPISYIKAHLDDSGGDRIELIIKMCQMFGPYTYRNLARGTLDMIKEEDEAVASTSSVVVTEPLSMIIEEETPITIEEAVTVEEAVVVTVEDPVTVEEVAANTPVVINIEPAKPVEAENPTKPENTENPTKPVQQQQIQEISGCCCFVFCQRRKR